MKAIHELFLITCRNPQDSPCGRLAEMRHAVDARYSRATLWGADPCLPTPLLKLAEMTEAGTLLSPGPAGLLGGRFLSCLQLLLRPRGPWAFGKLLVGH